MAITLLAFVYAHLDCGCWGELAAKPITDVAG